MILMARVLAPKRWFDGSDCIETLDLWSELTTNGPVNRLTQWIPAFAGMTRTERTLDPGVLSRYDPEFNASMRTAAGLNMA